MKLFNLQYQIDHTTNTGYLFLPIKIFNKDDVEYFQYSTKTKKFELCNDASIESFDQAGSEITHDEDHMIFFIKLLFSENIVDMRDE